MNHGKNTCHQLKAIRQQIADANGIEYCPHECTFEGEYIDTTNVQPIDTSCVSPADSTKLMGVIVRESDSQNISNANDGD